MHQFEIGQSVEIMFAAINRVPIWRAGTVERVHEATKDYFGDLPARIDVLVDGERHTRFLNVHPVSVRRLS